MIAYQPASWHDLFVTAGGASATLAGLLFVAVSLNHEQIVQAPHLPALAAVSIVLLIGQVVFAVLGLVPGQPRAVLGYEVLTLGVALAASVARIFLHGRHGIHQRNWRLTRAVMTVTSTLPMIIAGISLITRTGGGLYWIAAEIISAVITATYNAWVLLIEIRR